MTAEPDQLAVWDEGWRAWQPQANAFVQRCWRWIEPLGAAPAVLELGCGAGSDALWLARHGCRVTATDFATSAVETTRQRAEQARVPLAVQRVDLRAGDLPFADRTFDAVYAHLSLHYFSTPRTRELLAACARVLRPGGMLCIRCKSIDDPLYGQGEQLDAERFVLHGHLRHFFSRAEMADLLADWRILRLRRTRGSYAGHPSAFVEAIARR